MTAVPESEPLGPMTFDEFLALEEAGELKHELVDGFVYPWGETDPASGLAGASRRHNRIGFRIARLLGDAADRAGCDVFGSDMLLRISDRLAYYPDVQLACDPTDDVGEFAQLRSGVRLEVDRPTRPWCERHACDADAFQAPRFAC